jgi:hypothetical protein
MTTPDTKAFILGGCAAASAFLGLLAVMALLIKRWLCP